jgi:hypothetical protein
MISGVRLTTGGAGLAGGAWLRGAWFWGACAGGCDCGGAGLCDEGPEGGGP